MFEKGKQVVDNVKDFLVRQYKISKATLELLEDLGVTIIRNIDDKLRHSPVLVTPEGFQVFYENKTLFEGTGDDIKRFVDKIEEINKSSGGNGRKKVKKYLDDFAEQFGKTINVVSKGKTIAKFTRGKEIELLGIRFKNIFGGTKIILKEDATVAITGLLDDVLKIKGLGRKIPGLWKNGVNIGGTDLLSSKLWGELGEKYKYLLADNPKLFWKNRTDDFWELVNKPWLDEIIKRGDDVRFVTNPNLEKSKYVYIEGTQEFATGLDGKKVQTIFGREVEYLKKNGYKIENELAIKIKK